MATERTTGPLAGGTNAPLKQQHSEQAKEARDTYLRGQTSSDDAVAWRHALQAARIDIRAALSASGYLTDIANALRKSGEHMLVFRHLLAPPLSQDQFKLVCPSWSKGTEKSGKPVKINLDDVASVFAQRRDRFLSPWVDANRAPTIKEVKQLLLVTCSTFSSHSFR